MRANTSHAVRCSGKHSEQDELIDYQQADCSLWPAFQRDLSPKHYFIFLSAQKADSVLPHVKLSSQSQLDVLSAHFRWLRGKSCCNVSPWHRHMGCTYPAGQQVKLPACFYISRWCLQATLILGQNLPWEEVHGQCPFSIFSLFWWDLAHPTHHCKIHHSQVGSQEISVHNQCQGRKPLAVFSSAFRLGREL